MLNVVIAQAAGNVFRQSGAQSAFDCGLFFALLTERLQSRDDWLKFRVDRFRRWALQNFCDAVERIFERVEGSVS